MVANFLPPSLRHASRATNNAIYHAGSPVEGQRRWLLLLCKAALVSSRPCQDSYSRTPAETLSVRLCQCAVECKAALPSKWKSCTELQSAACFWH